MHGQRSGGLDLGVKENGREFAGNTAIDCVACLPGEHGNRAKYERTRLASSIGPGQGLGRSTFYSNWAKTLVSAPLLVRR